MFYPNEGVVAQILPYNVQTRIALTKGPCYIADDVVLALVAEDLEHRSDFDPLGVALREVHLELEVLPSDLEGGQFFEVKPLAVL